MALTEPLDLLIGWPGWSPTFELMARQEQSRSAGGRTRVKDFGEPLWRASYVTCSLRANALDALRARVSHAMVSQMTFMGVKLSRCRPIAHPGLGALPEGELYDIGVSSNAVRIEGLTGISLSVGDLVRIGTGLYELLEATSGNPTALATIQPHLWPGTVTGQAVVIDRPWVAMTVDPGSLNANADPRTGRGTISFTATEAR